MLGLESYMQGVSVFTVISWDLRASVPRKFHCKNQNLHYVIKRELDRCNLPNQKCDCQKFSSVASAFLFSLDIIIMTRRPSIRDRCALRERPLFQTIVMMKIQHYLRGYGEMGMDILPKNTFFCWKYLRSFYILRMLNHFLNRFLRGLNNSCSCARATASAFNTCPQALHRT